MTTSAVWSLESPRSYSADLTRILDRELNWLETLYEENFIFDRESKELLCFEVWESYQELLSPWHLVSTDFRHLSIGDLAWSLARNPKAVRGIYRNAREFCEWLDTAKKKHYKRFPKYTELAWFSLGSQYYFRIETTIYDWMKEVSKLYGFYSDPFERAVRFFETSSKMWGDFHIVTNDIDAELLADVLAGGECHEGSFGRPA